VGPRGEIVPEAAESSSRWLLAYMGIVMIEPTWTPNCSVVKEASTSLGCEATGRWPATSFTRGQAGRAGNPRNVTSSAGTDVPPTDVVLFRKPGSSTAPLT